MSAERSSPHEGELTERARIESALLGIVTESGLASATPAAIAGRVGIEERVFHRHFNDVQEVYFGLVSGFIDEFLDQVVGAFRTEAGWRNKIRAAAYSILRFFQEDETRAQFTLTEMLSPDPRVQLLRDQALAVMIDLIDEGRSELADPDSKSRATAEGVAGAIYTQVWISLRGGSFADADPHVSQLMYTVVLPYAGSATALEELQIPPPDQGWARPPRPRVERPRSRYPGGVSEERSAAEVDTPEELGPLPAGRHGLSREQVAHNQRERLVAGLAHAVAEHGYHDTTITHITKAASVSRRVFYENFAGKEDCFLAAFDIIVAHLRELMADAAQPIPDWPHQVVAGLGAMLRFFASEPELARLSLIDSLAAGPVVGERYRTALLGFAPMLEPGRAFRASARPLPASREESLLGGLTSLISRSIASGRTEQLEELLPDLTEFLLTPYLGPDEAERLAAEVE